VLVRTHIAGRAAGRVVDRVVGHVVDNWPRLLRYGGTSAVGVVLGQTILRLGYDLLGWSALVANLVAFVIANIPVYYLNRSWVWDRVGPSHWATEVLPFWLVSSAGLALSSLAVGLVDQATDNGWFITVSSVGAFGTVWLVKYAVCDRYLFGPEAASEATSEAATDAVPKLADLTSELSDDASRLAAIHADGSS